LIDDVEHRDASACLGDSDAECARTDEGLLDLATNLPGGISLIEATFTVEVPDKEALVFSTARA
jgi:hypothetical protein